MHRDRWFATCRGRLPIEVPTIQTESIDKNRNPVIDLLPIYDFGMPADCEIDNCGVLALGRCLSCGRAFCASHQAKEYWSSQFSKSTVVLDICWQCVDEQERNRNRVKPPIPEVLARHKEWAESIDRAVEIAKMIGDPTERLLAGFLYWTKDPYSTSTHNFALKHSKGQPDPSIQAVDPALFSGAFPRFWSSPVEVDFEEKRPPWNSDAIAKWFAKKAESQGIIAPAIPGTRGSGLFARELRGWLLYKTNRHVSVEHDFYEHAIIDAQGNVREAGAQLHARALRQLAIILKISDPGIAISRDA